jgi:hypothetical protein
MEELYPELKALLSEEFITEETVFEVNGSDTPYVDEKGIIHVDINFFRYMVSAISEFFRTYQQGVELKQAFAGLIKLLSGGYNEHNRSI